MERFHAFDIEADYEAMHRTFQPAAEAPVIGLTGNFADGTCKLLEGYYASIRQAGGTPMIIPPTDDRATMLRSLEAVDGLLLTGGADLNPLFLGEEPVRALSDINPQRDRFELLLTRLAADRQIPILGICRGIQVMNAAFGGSLYQDIYSQALPPKALPPTPARCSNTASNWPAASPRTVCNCRRAPCWRRSLAPTAWQ